MFAALYHRRDELGHLDFTVAAVGPAILHGAYRRLIRHGARPTEYSPSTTGGWAAMVKDPAGFWIRLGRSPRRSVRR